VKAAQAVTIAACAALTASIAPAWAAGGHHAVDDAAILDPGRCEVETWFTRSAGQNALHAGPGCRVGLVEISAAFDRSFDARAVTIQAKAAWPLAESLNAGVFVAPFRRSGATRESGVAAAALATWTYGPWTVHANVGREFVSGRSRAKSGAAVEWAPAAAWSWVAERYVDQGGHFLRAGARWQPAAEWTLDITHARKLYGQGASGWTIGATRGFAAP
jgi:hypothetical protein